MLVVVNPCGTGNGGCSHFCLLSATDPRGYSCNCPEGMLMTNDSLNCFESEHKAIYHTFMMN